MGALESSLLPTAPDIHRRHQPFRCKRQSGVNPLQGIDQFHGPGTLISSSRLLWIPTAAVYRTDDGTALLIDGIASS